MVQFPIWQNTNLTTPSQGVDLSLALQFKLLDTGVIFYTAKVFPQPGTNNIILNLNEILRNFIYDIDTLPLATAVQVDTNYTISFSIGIVGGAILESYTAYNSWAYEDAPFSLAAPINSLLAPGQWLLSSFYNQTVNPVTVNFKANGVQAAALSITANTNSLVSRKELIDNTYLCGSKFGFTETSQMSVSGFWNSIAFGNGVWVAMVNDPSSHVNYSYDGATWIAATGVPSGYYGQVIFAGDQFIAFSRNEHYYITSPDGITWTQGEVTQTKQWVSTAYGNETIATIAYASNVVAYSVDGGNFWGYGTMPSSTHWAKIRFLNNKFYAVQESSVFFGVSDDAITWAQGTFSGAANWVDIAFGNNKYLAIGVNTDHARTSTDGETWTGITLPLSSEWEEAQFINGKFIVMSKTHVITSPDLITWTTTVLSPVKQWSSFAFGLDKYVMVGKSTDNVLISTNAIDWNTFDIIQEYTLDNNGNDGYKYVIYYINKFGGWDSYAVPGIVYLSDNITRNMVAVGSVKHLYKNTLQPVWTCNTGAMTVAEMLRMPQLIESIEVKLHNLATNEITDVIVANATASYANPVGDETRGYEIVLRAAAQKFNE